MSAHFESVNLSGFAHWTRYQAKEELEHALKLFDYVNDRGGRVRLQAVQQPPVEYKSTSEIFKEILAHEQKVTGLIHDLYRLAAKEDDPATQIVLQWFVTEQVEEEKSAALIVDQLQLIEDRGTAVLMLDKQLGKRGNS
jgi:ferritin